MTKEFLGFLKQYGVVGLAIAVIPGGKLNAFVTSIVNDLFLPLVFQPLLKAAQVDDITKLNFHRIFYGKVIGATIDFSSWPCFFFAKRLFRDTALLIKK